MARKRFTWLALLAAALLALPTTVRAQDDGIAKPQKPAKTVQLDHAPDGNILVYRRVSDWEMRQITKRGALFVTPGSGESFVSTSRAYVDQLGARHPKDYANLMVIEVDPKALPELEKIGLRASGSLLEQLYPNMPEMEGGRPDAVHFKAELGALNLGFRDGSVKVFNQYVRGISVDKTARLEVPKNAGSIKQGQRDKAAKERAKRGLHSGVSTGPEADESDIARFTDHVENHGGSVERVPAEDLPEGVTAHTTLDEDGKPLVLLPETGVKKLALVEELTHVIQLERALAKSGVAAVSKLLDDARDGVSEAVKTVEGWEVTAHKLMLQMLGQDDPARVDVEARLAEHESAIVDAATAGPSVASLAGLTIPELVARIGSGELPDGPLTKAALIAKITGGDPAKVAAELASAPANNATASGTIRDRARERDAEIEKTASRGIASELERARTAAEDRVRVDGR
jgi:hypothetical protein